MERNPLSRVLITALQIAREANVNVMGIMGMGVLHLISSSGIDNATRSAMPTASRYLCHCYKLHFGGLFLCRIHQNILPTLKRSLSMQDFVPLHAQSDARYGSKNMANRISRYRPC